LFIFRLKCKYKNKHKIDPNDGLGNIQYPKNIWQKRSKQKFMQIEAEETRENTYTNRGVEILCPLALTCGSFNFRTLADPGQM